ncbi:molybdate ABC transporter substrate-binding protein [Pseudomaricurvus albidus]|uniref:molybdate ABC transporter substrate-binding protein n=1 Tax=Pseudomaricurvus albidus TaxID=2842452 RepID=UPI0034E255AE
MATQQDRDTQHAEHPIASTLTHYLSLLVFAFLTASSSHADDIHIAVASNFTSAMKEVTKAFEENTSHQVKLSFGSSGKLYAQISHGAPFELFFSADQSKPIALEKNGLAIKGSRFTYAEGSLALWTVKDSFADLTEKTLTERKYRKLALANPRLAPYGQAAVEVLNELNLASTTRKKWVQGENISQTYQFVSTGNAELGFVALSQILNHDKGIKGSAWIIPHNLYKPIRQDAVLLMKGKSSQAAREFMSFITGNQARTIIESHGYKTSTNSQ